MLVKGRNVKNEGRLGDSGGTVRERDRKTFPPGCYIRSLGLHFNPIQKGKGKLEKKWDQTLGVTSTYRWHRQ